MEFDGDGGFLMAVGTSAGKVWYDNHYGSAITVRICIVFYQQMVGWSSRCSIHCTLYYMYHPFMNNLSKSLVPYLKHHFQDIKLLN